MAGELLEKGLRMLRSDLETVRGLRKNDVRKQALCWLLKSRSVVSNEWIGERLGMGHWSNSSRAFRAIESPATSAARRMKTRMLKCTD